MQDPRVSQLLNRLGGLYRDPGRVTRDASKLLKSSVGKNLIPQIATLVENNGSSTSTLCMAGTIAFDYRGTTYQQLMDIYLPPGYPLRGPVCFVRLAPNMYLKENHQHVGADGKVYLPYLSEWRPHTHTLVQTVVAMSSVFGVQPAVYSRPPTAAVEPMGQPPPPAYSTAYTTTTAAAAYVSASADVTSDAEAILAREAEEANLAAEAARRADKEEEEREKQRRAQAEWDAKNLTATREKLRRKIQAHLQDQSKETKKTLEQDQEDQLRLSNSPFPKQKKTLEATKKELEKQIEAVDKATMEIEEWLKDASESKSAEEETTIDDMVKPISPVHAQLLQLSVENHALTDAMYFLDRGLNKKTIDVTTHLRQIRALSKKQFLARAHLIKISQALAN